MDSEDSNDKSNAVSEDLGKVRPEKDKTSL